MQLSVRYFVRKNIRNLFIAFGIMAFITFFYMKFTFPTIINMIFAPFELDYLNAFEEPNLMTVTGNGDTAQINDNLLSLLSDAQNGAVSEQFKMLADKSRTYNIDYKNISDYADIYMQNNKYKFQIKPEKVYDLDLYYETKYTMSVGGLALPSSEAVPTHKYLLLDAGKAFILTKVEPDFEIEQGQVFEGIFIPHSQFILYDLSNILGQGKQLDNLFIYEFDTLADFTFLRKVNWFILLFLH